MLDSMRQFKAGIFQALGHPTRIAIVEFLSLGEMSVGRLCENVGIEQANASQHLAVLRSTDQGARCQMGAQACPRPAVHPADKMIKVVLP